MLERLAFENWQTFWPRHSFRFGGLVFLARFADSAEPKPYRGARSGRNIERVVRRCFGAGPFWIHRLGAASDDKIVDRILHESALVRRGKEPFCVGLVLGEEEIARVFAMELVIAQGAMGRLDRWTLAG